MASFCQGGTLGTRLVFSMRTIAKARSWLRCLKKV
jgi:hypothetical protein